MSSYTVINPADESEVARVEHIDREGTDSAVARAVVAQREWARRAPVDRARALRQFAEAVDGDIENLAQLETANAGHPISQSRWEASNVRDVLDYYSGAPERLIGQQIPVTGGLDVTIHEPVGVVGIITPWNFPMPIAVWGFAPALAAGNAVVLKPAEWTPLTSIRLGELALESGLPEGLFQVLPGKGSVIGDRFVSHPDVSKIVFTGSTAVGKQIMSGCSHQVKRFTLELGGKSANVIFADADLELAAASAPGAVFDNAGQDCCARSRILVERSAYDRFMELFESAVKAFRVGDPTDPETAMGPLVTAKHHASVSEFIRPDLDIAFTGSAPGGPGNWFAPTVVTPATLTDPVYTDEVFGPVVAVVPFDTEEDAFRLANDSPFGLSGSIWTRDAGRAIRAARAIEAGNLSVNSNSSVRYATPFGGFKQSGFGRELGPDAPLSFTETKNVFISSS